MNSTASSKIIRFPTYRALSRKDNEWNFPDPGPQSVKVLVGDWDSGIGKGIVDYLNKIFENRYRLRVRMTDCAVELRGLAEYCDVFISVLNNIYFAPDNSPVDRLTKSLLLARHCRRRYRKPVIGLTSLKRQPLISEAKKSVDYLFYHPASVPTRSRHCV